MEMANYEMYSAIAAIYGTIGAFSSLLGIVFFIFTSLGLYTLAKRRGIPRPGLAWVPAIGQPWIVGSLADQYDYLSEGKVKRQRQLLLWLNIGIWVLLFVFCGLLIAMIINGVVSGTTYGPEAILSSTIGLIIAYGIMLIAAIVYSVFFYIALYKVYKSCNPSNATLHLVLSIVIGATMPFFIFFNRNKDEGLPQRGQGSEEPNQIA